MRSFASYGKAALHHHHHHHTRSRAASTDCILQMGSAAVMGGGGASSTMTTNASTGTAPCTQQQRRMHSSNRAALSVSPSVSPLPLSLPASPTMRPDHLDAPLHCAGAAAAFIPSPPPPMTLLPAAKAQEEAEPLRTHRSASTMSLTSQPDHYACFANSVFLPNSGNSVNGNSRSVSPVPMPPLPQQHYAACSFYPDSHHNFSSAPSGGRGFSFFSADDVTQMATRMRNSSSANNNYCSSSNRKFGISKYSNSNPGLGSNDNNHFLSEQRRAFRCASYDDHHTNGTTTTGTTATTTTTEEDAAAAAFFASESKKKKSSSKKGDTRQGATTATDANPAPQDGNRGMPTGSANHHDGNDATSNATICLVAADTAETTTAIAQQQLDSYKITEQDMAANANKLWASLVATPDAMDAAMTAAGPGEAGGLRITHNLSYGDNPWQASCVEVKRRAPKKGGADLAKDDPDYNPVIAARSAIFGKVLPWERKTIDRYDAMVDKAQNSKKKKKSEEKKKQREALAKALGATSDNSATATATTTTVSALESDDTDASTTTGQQQQQQPLRNNNINLSMKSAAATASAATCSASSTTTAEAAQGTGNHNNASTGCSDSDDEDDDNVDVVFYFETSTEEGLSGYQHLATRVGFGDLPGECSNLTGVGGFATWTVPRHEFLAMASSKPLLTTMFSSAPCKEEFFGETGNGAGGGGENASTSSSCNDAAAPASSSLNKATPDTRSRPPTTRTTAATTMKDDEADDSHDRYDRDDLYNNTRKLAIPYATVVSTSIGGGGATASGTH